MNLSEKNYIFYSMRRSGTHMIINYIKEHEAKPSFIQSVNHPMYTKDEFLQLAINKPKRVFNTVIKENPKAGDFLYDRSYINYESINYDFFVKNWQTHKVFLEQHFAGSLDLNNSNFITILRDPRNVVASSLNNWFANIQIYNIANVYNGIANEFLVEPKLASEFNFRLYIIYDDFISDLNYRKFILNKLNLTVRPDELDLLNYVPKWGRGSSFDGQRFQNNGLQMETSDRYLQFQDNKTYKYIVTTELVETFQNLRDKRWEIS